MMWNDNLDYMYFIKHCYSDISFQKLDKSYVELFAILTLLQFPNFLFKNRQIETNQIDDKKSGNM